MKMPCLVYREHPYYQGVVFNVNFSKTQLTRMEMSTKIINLMFELIKTEAIQLLVQINRGVWKMEEIKLDLNPRRLGKHSLLYLTAHPSTPEIDLTNFPAPKWEWEL